MENEVQVSEDPKGDVTPIPILAWDFSGSTSSMAYYHSLGSRYLDKFIGTYSNSPIAPTYLQWNTECRKIQLADLKSIIKNKTGSGGTSPSTIVHWIKKSLAPSAIVDLWLITDGEIDSSELTRCAQLNKEVHYSSVHFIIISQSRRLDMSVGAAFFGGGAAEGTVLKISVNENIFKEINTSKPYDYNSINIHNFQVKLPELSDYIQAKFMGTELQGLEEVDKLSKLRSVLFHQLQEEQNVNVPDAATEVNWRDAEAMLSWLRTTKYYKGLKNVELTDCRSQIDSSISTLINYIHNKHKSCQFFDILKINFKQDKLAEVADNDVEEDMNLEDMEDADKCNFFDAITLDVEQSTPVLFLNDCDLIDKYWIKMNSKRFSTVVVCPLFGDFEECIGHVFGFETVKLLLTSQGESEVLRNPMTNQPTHGGLILSQKFDDWNDRLLLQAFFRSKQVHTCPALFYYKIWKYASACSWIEEGVVDLLGKYAARRIATATTRLAFSSLPLDPQEIVPLPLAIFYCTEGASRLFGEDPELFLKERLRLFWIVANDFVDILKLLQVNCDIDLIQQRATAFKYLSALKTIGQEIERKYWFLSRCFKKKGDFLTYEIEHPEVLPYLALLNYHHKGLIPFQLPPFDFNTISMVSYDYECPYQVPLVPETARPRFAITEGGELVPNYKPILKYVSEVQLNKFGEVVSVLKPTKLEQAKLMSLYKQFINATTLLGKFPSHEEFSSFVFKQKRFVGDKVRLFPLKIEEWIDETIQQYKHDISEEANVVIQRGKESVSAANRMRIEGSLKDEDNKWAVKFVQNARDKWLTQSSSLIESNDFIT